MMHNTYSGFCSIVLFRTSFGFNDFTHTNYYPNERCSSSYCACCCPLNVNSSRLMVPINLNPSIIYGLRQSTLIQLPHSRRIVWGSSDRHCYRVSSFDMGRCWGDCCCVKEQVVGSCKEKCCVEKMSSVGVHKVRRSCKESKNVGVDRTRGRLSRRERDFRCNALGDAEAMLSFLSEASIAKGVIVRNRRKGSSKEARIVRGQHVVSKNSKDGEDNELLGYSETKSNKQEEEHKRREERESLLVNEGRRSRRKESASSCYAVCDSAEFESDTEVDVKEVYVGASSTSLKKDSRKTGGVSVSGVNKQDFERNKDEKEQQLTSSRHDNVRVGSSSDWDCRKKSEKKLTEELIERSNRKESILRQPKVSQANESSSIVASSVESRRMPKEEEPTSDLSSHRQSRSGAINDDRSEYSKISGRHEYLISDVRSQEHSRSDFIPGYQANDYLVSGRQQEQPISDSSFLRQSTSQINPINQGSEYLISGQRHEQATQVNRQQLETTSTSWRRSMQGEAAMVAGQSVQETGCEHCRTCGRSLQTNKMKTDIQQHVELSETRVGARWTTTLESQSESRHREQEVGLSSLLGSVEEESKLQDQLNSEAQLNARVSAGKYCQTENTDHGYVQNTMRSQLRPETRQKKIEESSTTYSSAQYEERLLEEPAGKVIEEPESSQVLQTGTSASQVHSFREEIDGQSATDKRLHDEQTHSTSKVMSMNELVEKRKLIDETIVLTRVRTEVPGPVVQASITANFSGEVSSSQPIPALVSQPGVRHSNEVVQVNNELQIPMISSSSQVMKSKSSVSEQQRSSGRNDSERATDLVSGGTHVEPPARKPPPSAGVNDSDIKSLADALGSAQRLQESSTRIVAEFIENMRHESSTCGTKSDKKMSQLDNRHLLKGASQIDSDKSRLVKLVPNHSLGFPGTKGPSDELAGVKGQSVDDASESGSLDGAISSVISRRTGKSLWSIVASIFRLRWGSSSPVKTSQLSSPNDCTADEASPNDSTGGETWFSGNDQEEGNGDSMIREEVRRPQEPMSSYPSLPKRSTSKWRKEDLKSSEPLSMPQEPSSDQPLLRRISRRARKDRRKTGQGSSSPESTSQHPLHRSAVTDSQTGDITIMSLDDKLRPDEQDSLSYFETAQGGPLSVGTSIGENIDFSISQQTSLYIPLDLSVPSARLLGRADAIGEIEQGSSVLDDLSTGANVDLNMPLQTSVSSLLPGPSAGRLRGTGGFEEIEEDSSDFAVLSIARKTELNMPRQSSSSNPLDVAVPSSKQLRRTYSFEEIEEAEENVEQRRSSGDERDAGPPNLFVPSTGQLSRVDAFEEIEEAEDEGLNSPTCELLKQSVGSVDMMQTVVSVSEKSDNERKQRKLQRTDKLIIERFGEWEDAYRRENEQRKVDEIFMREALAEAIKAADSWEVPVGAVLVQNGNIIARGYNLVEELRDSTAHAEMICIREASNVLRTWRLSEATLYVTLEPCPMCAGAILQARIGTLVWGAPNKLLGADGSWIRLFPEGIEGEQRSEIADKPAAPKHPFHPNMKIRRGVLESECAQVMQQFFQLRRKKEKGKEKKSEEAQPSCLPVPHHPSKLFHKMLGAFHLFCL